VAGRPEVMQRLSGIQSGLVARGLDPGTARQTAGRVLDGMITRQSTLLAFERMFVLAGVAFLFVIPFALLLKPPAGSRSKQRVDLH
jgi:MFS transporter, DHA2 family, multidrug resistance protein